MLALSFARRLFFGFCLLIFALVHRSLRLSFGTSLPDAHLHAVLPRSCADLFFPSAFLPYVTAFWSARSFFLSLPFLSGVGLRLLALVTGLAVSPALLAFLLPGFPSFYVCPLIFSSPRPRAMSVLCPWTFFFVFVHSLTGPSRSPAPFPHPCSWSRLCFFGLACLSFGHVPFSGSDESLLRSRVRASFMAKMPSLSDDEIGHPRVITRNSFNVYLN